MTENIKAFLDTIAVSEGTAGKGDDGYNVLVGGGFFTLDGDYHDHPRKVVHFSNGLASTAAGRYQIIDHTYDIYKAKLGLTDFSPASQDKIACALIQDHGGMTYVEDGQFDLAISKVCKVWASLPGAGYGQRENKLATLRNIYSKDGGALGAQPQQEGPVPVNLSHVGYTAGGTGALVTFLVWITHWPLQPLDAKDTAPAVATLIVIGGSALIFAVKKLFDAWTARSAAKALAKAAPVPVAAASAASAVKAA